MIRPVEDFDFDQIFSWYKKHNINTYPFNITYDKEWFSQTGFIEPNIAAGFVYLTNSKRAYIEDFISNPDVSKEDRDNALNKIVYKIETLCQDNKIKYIMAATNHAAIINRALSHGYQLNTESFRIIVKVV